MVKTIIHAVPLPLRVETLSLQALSPALGLAPELPATTDPTFPSILRMTGDGAVE
jgi:hypothetical protein